MSMLIARFKCLEIRKDELAETVVLAPAPADLDPKGVNSSWSTAKVPVGRFTLIVNNKSAFGKFKVGEFYSLDFNPN